MRGPIEEEKLPDATRSVDGVLTMERLQAELVKLRPTQQEMAMDQWSRHDVRSIVKLLYYYNLYTKRFSKVRTTVSIASVARKFNLNEYRIRMVCEDWFKL